MRSIWSGALSFGLINIPVYLYSATEEHPVSFDLLHKTDLSPIRYARICKKEEKEIPYEDIVKGYEYQKGEYVVLEESDFQQIAAQKSGSIDILHFANEEEVDSIYFDKPYFLEPGKGASKAYALLRDALQQSAKVGIIRFVFRNKEHIGLIKPHFEVLVLNQMRFASEIRSIKGLNLPGEGESSKKEVEMAIKLIDQLTESFDPNVHQDHYLKDLKEMIERKVRGIEPMKKKKAVKSSSKVHDILSLLKESLEESVMSQKSRKRSS